MNGDNMANRDETDVITAFNLLALRNEHLAGNE